MSAANININNSSPLRDIKLHSYECENYQLLPPRFLLLWEIFQAFLSLISSTTDRLIWWVALWEEGFGDVERKGERLDCTCTLEIVKWISKDKKLGKFGQKYSKHLTETW